MSRIDWKPNQVAFVLSPDLQMRDIQPANGQEFQLEELQKIVGGFIEVLYLQNALMILDEEGKLKNKPTNKLATQIWRTEGGLDPIVGTVVICKSHLLT